MLRLLALRAPFLLQFLREIAQRPARREEIAVEVALRDELPRLSDAPRAQLAAVCVRQAQDCLGRLLAVAERRADRRFRGSLAGLAGCAKWCIKMAKVLSKDPQLPDFEPFWAHIEQMVRNQAAPSPRGGESEASSGSSEEGAANGDACGLAGESRREGKLRGKSASRLLLSFLESNGYDHVTVDLSAEGALTDVALLLIASPQKDFSDTELEEINEFAKEGGSLFITRDYTDPLDSMPNYLSLLRSYGATPLSGIAVDPGDLIPPDEQIIPDVR